MFSNETIEKFVQEWFDLLNEHAPVEQLLPLVSNSDLEMVFPERTLRNHTEVREWYDVVGKTYTNQQHIIEELHSDEKANNTEVNLKVVWKAEQKSDGSPARSDPNADWLQIPCLAQPARSSSSSWLNEAMSLGNFMRGI